MKRFRWIIVALAFFVLGIGSLAARWHGSANATMAWPAAGASVNFCGSAHGWAAIIGVLGLLLGLIFLIVGIVGAVTAQAATEA